MELFKDIYLVGSGEFGLSDPYDCHVYLIDGGEDAVLIDCGAGRDPHRILENAARYVPAGRLSRLLLTHVHADHSGGVAFFRQQGVNICAPAGEMAVLREKPEEVLEAFRLAKNAGAYPEDYEFPFFSDPDGSLEDGDEIIVGRYTLTAIHVAGHSEGLLCYLLDAGGKRVLFSSDYLFVNGLIGLLNCPGSELGAYRRDIARLTGLRVDALLPGHRMLALANGQQHIDQAAENLSKVFVPPTF